MSIREIELQERVLRIRNTTGLFLLDVEDTPVWQEVPAIEAGEPWAETQIAGLQHYDYGKPGLSDEPVMPSLCDRLVLVRAPDNEFDGNAIEVWWRNDVRLGHLPREVSAEVAPLIDAGASCRAYVASPGNGEPCSAYVLLLGDAVRPLHDRYRANFRPLPDPLPKPDYDADDDIPF